MYQGHNGNPQTLSSSPAARPHDFFDAQTMDTIRHRAICLNLATHIESVGHGHSVVFHSTVSQCAASLLIQVLYCLPLASYILLF